MDKNNEHNDQKAVSKAVAHEMETTETLYATEYIAPPPLFLASDPKHLKEEIEGEEKDQKIAPAEITDQEDQKNSPDPVGADMKSDAAVLMPGANEKEDEKEEELMDGPAADLIFADDTPEPPNDDGSEENGAAGGEDPGNGDDGNNNPIQKKEGNAASTSISSSSSSSSGVPAEVMAKMEASMGADFSNVKVHTNSSQAKDSNALAFAKGNDIHFAPGKFDPSSNSGQKLLGHELAHVKQQRQGKVKPTTSINGMSVNDDPALEKAADIEGDKAANYKGPIQKKEAPPSNSVNIVQQKESLSEAPASSSSNDLSQLKEDTPITTETKQEPQVNQLKSESNSASDETSQLHVESNENTDNEAAQQKEDSTPNSGVAQLQEDKTLFEELSAESGNLIRSLAEIARLVPGLGIITGGVAQAINFEQDHSAAKEKAPNDEFLLFLVDYRNSINFVNGLVDDLLYLNQVIGDCGGHATGITEVIGIIGGLINNGLDSAQVTIDIITTAYTSTAATFPKAFDVDNVGVYEDFALGYAANTVADSVGLVLGIIDTATAATGQGAVADRLGDGFFAMTRLQQVVRIICRKLADPQELFGLITGVLVGVNGGSILGAAEEATGIQKGVRGVVREGLAGALDGYINHVDTTWNLGADGLEFMAEAIPATFEMARAGLIELCDGEDPILWIRDKMVQGINDATEQAEQMNFHVRNLVEADQSLDTVIKTLDEIGAEISALEIPTDIFPEHTEVGDNPIADAVEGVIDAGADLANQAANELIAELQQRLDEFKKDALEKLEKAKEFSVKVQLVVKHAANLFLDAHSQCLEIIEKFSARLSEAETLEDFLNVALGTVGDVIGIEGGLSVEDMQAKWNELREFMDSSFERAHELVNEYIRNQDPQQNKEEEPAQQKAIEPARGGTKSDASLGFEKLFNTELQGFDLKNIAQDFLPEAHSLEGLERVEGMMGKITEMMKLPDEISGIMSDPAGTLMDKASSFLESSGLGSVIDESSLNGITDFTTSLQFKKDENKSSESIPSDNDQPIQKFDWDFGIGEAIENYKNDHYNRNQHNQAPQQEPVNDPNWRRLPYSQSIYHQNGEGRANRKYVSVNGGNHEAVYDENGQLVTDDANMGTYNYSGPDDTFGHLVDDVVPYWLFGNNENDDTPLANRIAGPRILERTGNAIGDGVDAAGDFLGNMWNSTGGKLFGNGDDAAQQKSENDQNPDVLRSTSSAFSPVQKKENNAESNQEEGDIGQFKISDIIPAGVNVHKESSKAKEMGALAFAQGSDIHFAPGQFNPNTRKGQELIGHELGHVVQQKEGRVEPTTQLKGENINDDKGLEKEADDFGVKFADSLQNKSEQPVQNKIEDGFSLSTPALQKKENPNSSAPLQLQAEEGGGNSEGSGPISIDGSQEVAKDLMASQPLPLFDKIKTAPASLNAAMSSESTELNGSFPNIEQPTGLENQPLAGSETVQAPHHLGYAGQGGPGDVTTPANTPTTPNLGPNADLAPTQATASPPSPVPTANVTPPSSTSLTLGEETVDYSAGPRPEIDTSGDADPAQMTIQETQDTAKVERDKSLADIEIDKDHGEEDIFPHYDELANLTPDVEMPQGQNIPVPQFEELTEKSAEIDAGFNDQAQAKLDADMAQHVAANDAEVQKMNQGSQEEWNTYETSKTEEEARVKQEQETAQRNAKTEVSTQQTNWKKENDDVKKKFVDDAAAAKTDYQGKIDTEIDTSNANVEATLAQAEVDAQAKADEAKQDAEEKERESEEKKSGGFFGWLADKAAKAWNWLKDQFNAIINWLKEAVAVIIEAAKTVANTIIETARRAITSLITAFGNLLKTFVDIAFAAFPEIRDRIKDTIDTVVNTAVEAVNTLAEGLKNFVNALLDALGAALILLLDTYQKFINLLFSLIEFLVVGLYELYKGLTNLALSAKQSPGEFMGQLQEEFLGMNLNDKLPFERDVHPDPSYFRPPVEGESMPNLDMPPVLQKDPLSASDIEVTSISEPAGSELSEDIINTIPDGGEKEFGGSGVDELDLLRQAYSASDSEEGGLPPDAEEFDPAMAYPYADLADDPHARADAELDTFLGNQPAPDGASASKDSGGTQADSSSIEESAKIGPFTPGQRFRYLRTQMWNGITSWFNANKVAIIAGIVAAVVVGIALIIASGGAVLSLIPPLMTVLGAFFLGEALVKAGVYLKNFLTKAWGGGAGLADGAKDFARALVIVTVELIFILLFDLNTVLKAAKRGLRGSLKMAAEGAQNTARAFRTAARETFDNTAKNLGRASDRILELASGGRKLITEGLSTGYSRGVKTVNGLMEKVKNLNFKKFKLVRTGRFFKLYGKVNPWVLLASGKIEEVNIKAGDSVGDAGTYTVKGSDETVDGILIGKRDNPTPSAFVENAIKNNEEGLESGAELFRDLDAIGDDALRRTAITNTKTIDYDALAREIGEAPTAAIKNRGQLAKTLPNKPPGSGIEAHHLIPVEVITKSELLQQAIEGGFKFNSEANGRWLKRFSSKSDELADGLHAAHPSYTAEVIERLNAAQLRLSRRGKEITPEIARREVDKIARELGQLTDRNSALVNPAKIDDLFKPVRGVSEDAFLASVSEFASDPELGKKICDLWKNQDWSAIETIFKDNNLNNWNDIIYPPTEGFVEITEQALKPGMIIDRFGGRLDEAGNFTDTGKFVAPDNVPFEARALTDASLALEYRKYRVVKEIGGVKAGPAIPWFDTVGMGTQFKLPIGIDQLLKDGIIELID